MSPPERAPELRRELGGQLRNQRERAQLLVVGEVAHLGERLGPDHRADGHGLGGVEHLPRLERRQVLVDLRLRRHVDPVVRVREDEAVHADHHRARQLLGQPERLDVQVERLLVRLGEELDPAGIAHRHAVRMVVPDVDRRADRAVADGHHDGKPEARGVVDRLGHEQQALARRRGVRARAGGGGADGDRHRRELRFDVDELAAGELARLHHLAHAFDDVRLRRDRVRADRLRAGRGRRPPPPPASLRSA